MKKYLRLATWCTLLSTAQLSYSEDQKGTDSTIVELKGKYAAKNFDSLIGTINGLNDELLKMHFKLYQGYVKNANDILLKLQQLSDKGESRTPEFAGLKRILGWEIDGMLLHEYYFENLGGSNKILDKNHPLYLKIIADFGSYEKWKQDFISTGMIRGIGWVIVYQDPKSGKLINAWINEHDLGHLSGGKPLLIMDVFEHAYITQYGLDRNKYIDVFFNNINWDEVSKRYQL